MSFRPELSDKYIQSLSLLIFGQIESLKATRPFKLNEVVTPMNEAKCVDDVTIWAFIVFSSNVIKENRIETKKTSQILTHWKNSP